VTSTGAAIAPGSNILFGWDDKRIFLRGVRGELLTIPVPNSPSLQTSPKPRVFRPPAGEVLVGAGTRRGQAEQLAVTQTGGELVVHTLSKRGGASVGCARFRLARAVAEDAPLGLLCPLPYEVSYFLDARGRLLSLVNGEAKIVEERVTAVRHGYDDLTLVTDGAPPAVRVIHSRKIVTDRPAMEVPADARGRGAVFGPSGIVALRTSDETWVVRRGRDKADLHRTTRAGDVVVGVVDNADASRSGLVVLDASRTRIERIGQGAVETWVTSPAPILHARVSDMKGHIAFLTADGALCVHEPHARARVLYLAPRAP
jgi:hypothetical protein